MSCIYKYKGKDYTKDEFYSLVRTTMVQPKVVPKYNKILFPTGNTASKIEGHSTLEEFKKQKENRINQIDTEIQRLNNSTEAYDIETKDWGIDSLNNEKEQLKQELERVETEGFGALKPIYDFYENRISNILKKLGTVNLITDEYGNTWNELTVSDSKLSEQIDLIKFQAPNIEYKGDLAIEEKIMEMLEISPDQLKDSKFKDFIKKIIDFLKQIFSSSLTIDDFIRGINEGRFKTTVSSNNTPILTIDNMNFNLPCL